MAARQIEQVVERRVARRLAGGLEVVFELLEERDMLISGSDTFVAPVLISAERMIDNGSS